MGKRYGFTSDRESKDERELHHEIMRVEHAYGMHSREKKLAAILTALQAPHRINTAVSAIMGGHYGFPFFF